MQLDYNDQFFKILNKSEPLRSNFLFMKTWIVRHRATLDSPSPTLMCGTVARCVTLPVCAPRSWPTHTQPRPSRGAAVAISAPLLSIPTFTTAAVARTAPRASREQQHSHCAQQHACRRASTANNTRSYARPPQQRRNCTHRNNSCYVISTTTTAVADVKLISHVRTFSHLQWH